MTVFQKTWIVENTPNRTLANQISGWLSAFLWWAIVAVVCLPAFTDAVNIPDWLHNACKGLLFVGAFILCPMVLMLVVILCVVKLVGIGLFSAAMQETHIKWAEIKKPYNDLKRIIVADARNAGFTRYFTVFMQMAVVVALFANQYYITGTVCALFYGTVLFGKLVLHAAAKDAVSKHITPENVAQLEDSPVVNGLVV